VQIELLVSDYFTLNLLVLSVIVSAFALGDPFPKEVWVARLPDVAGRSPAPLPPPEERQRT
jgi:hypothetical protein